MEMHDRSFPIPVLRNKERCPYVSLYLDCHAGGFATAQCFAPAFHKECDFKKRVERKYDENGDAKENS